MPPVLWSTLAPVWSCAFLVTDKLLYEFQTIKVSGFKPVPVEIAKVAIKGKIRNGKKEYSGEPEDLIYKRKNLLKEVKNLPTLWGVAITGEMALRPKEENSQGRMQPFVVVSESSPDLFYTIYNNKRYGKPILCSEIWLDAKEV